MIEVNDIGLSGENMGESSNASMDPLKALKR
jgi:hypothetical protein